MLIITLRMGQLHSKVAWPKGDLRVSLSGPESDNLRRSPREARFLDTYTDTSAGRAAA